MSWTCRIHGLNLEHVTLPRLQVRDLGEVEGWARVSTEDSKARPSLRPWSWGAGSHSLVELSRVQAAPGWGAGQERSALRVPVCGGVPARELPPTPVAPRILPAQLITCLSARKPCPFLCPISPPSITPERSLGPSLTSFSGALHI